MRNYSSRTSPKTLQTGISDSATSMTLNNVLNMPTFPYTLVIEPDTDSEEIVTVISSGGGNVLNITRAQDGSVSSEHAAGAKVKHMVTARDLQEPQDHINASSAVHGVTGAVVGTTDTQTLTNKSLTSPTITGTGAIAGASLSITTSVSLPSNTQIGNVSSLELSYLDGVASAIQTQLDARAPINNATLTGNVTLPSTTSIGSVSSTELGYLDGVTSAIQTQITNIANGAKIRSGTATISTTSGAGSVAITFSPAFGATPVPIVSLAASDGQVYGARISSLSASGFTVNVDAVTDSVASSGITVTVYWIAMGA